MIFGDQFFINPIRAFDPAGDYKSFYFSFTQNLFKFNLAFDNKTIGIGIFLFKEDYNYVYAESKQGLQ